MRTPREDVMTYSQESVVIIEGKRTPIGAFSGTLSSLTAPKLGAHVISHVVKKSGLSPDEISEVIMGEVLTAGVGQAPARQATIFSGLPESIPALTLNKVCGSGMKALMLARQSLLTGESKVVVAGGMESMSQAPYLLPALRSGARMGNGQAIDSMVHDGLWDGYNNQHMGQCGELCARTHDLTRDQQDAYAMESFKRARANWENKHFANEVATLTIPHPKGDKVFEADESPFKNDLTKMASLKPVFDKNGTITAANASSISDGAAACVLTTESHAKQKGFKNYFRIIGTSTFAQKPEWFTTAPVGALKKLEESTKVKLADVSCFEINEAFAVVPMMAIRELKLDPSKVNPRGGAIALGHPIGASGARIVVTLMNHLTATGGRYGIGSLCIGGGEAVAMLIERV